MLEAARNGIYSASKAYFDPEILGLLIQFHPLHLEQAPDHFKQDHALMESAIGRWPFAYALADIHLKLDKSLALLALKQNPDIFYKLPDTFRTQSKEILLIAASQERESSTYFMNDASLELRQDPEILMATAKPNHEHILSVLYAHPHLLQDESFIHLCIQKNHHVFNSLIEEGLLDKNLIQNEDFAVKIIQNNPDHFWDILSNFPLSITQKPKIKHEILKNCHTPDFFYDIDTLSDHEISQLEINQEPETHQILRELQITLREYLIRRNSTLGELSLHKSPSYIKEYGTTEIQVMLNVKNRDRLLEIAQTESVLGILEKLTKFKWKDLWG